MLILDLQTDAANEYTLESHSSDQQGNVYHSAYSLTHLLRQKPGIKLRIPSLGIDRYSVPIDNDLVQYLHSCREDAPHYNPSLAVPAGLLQLERKYSAVLRSRDVSGLEFVSRFSIKNSRVLGNTT